MTKPKQVISDWIEDVQINGRGLTKWEEDFVLSLEDQFEETGSISDRQEEILDRIRTEKCP